MQTFIIISRDAHKSSRLINQHLTSSLGAARSAERAVCAVRLPRLMGLAARGKGVEYYGRPFDTWETHLFKNVSARDRSRLEERDHLPSTKLLAKSCHGSDTDPSVNSPRVSRRGSNTDSQVLLRAMNYYSTASTATRNHDFVGKLRSEFCQVIVYMNILLIVSLSFPKKW